MTILNNSVRIKAPPAKVWAVLAKLDALQEYDPCIAKSQVVSSAKEGLGATRQCDLTPSGSYKERVAEWNPHHSLAFELVECTFPVTKLRHRYTLTPDGAGTLVTQQMEYEMKFGLLGRLMDKFLVRKQWNAGIKHFFDGLTHYAETGQPPEDKRQLTAAEPLRN